MHESIVERLMYKVVKRHIAGTTISSAIETAKALNSRGVPVSISFLSSSVDKLPKARYAAYTYTELLHRIARFGLKASVHMPLEEIGYLISKESSLSYLRNIVQLGNRLGIFIWAELPGGAPMPRAIEAKGLGYAIGINEDIDALPDKRMLKLIFPPNGSVSSKEDKSMSEAHERELAIVRKALSRAGSVVLHAPPDKLVGMLMKNKAYKNSLIFEFQLGYERKRLAAVKNKGWNVSMYVPFGKGWVDYAVKRIQGHYTHIIASKLLDGKKG
ncbi:MAG: hypothetical protein ACP5T3_02045 [Candidatus Micrarchaeia archaeon]